MNRPKNVMNRPDASRQFDRQLNSPPNFRFEDDFQILFLKISLL